MKTLKKFHLGDILSITDGKLVSPRHIDGVYDILNHLFSENLSTLGLLEYADRGKQELVSQFPWTKTAPVLAEELERLPKIMSECRDTADRTLALNKWLKNLTDLYGEEHYVSSVS
jgi:hypothetical protein